ncbi:MAG: carbohydrate kinase family protein [Cyclobacteriaceae bacterium]|nr:carbohydrate kinase family protein [Cyclobacteriaceae bacterium]
MHSNHSDNIVISGVGCALVDLIYNKVSFESPAFNKYTSKHPGDGGLSPGKLVFTEELEAFSGKTLKDLRSDVVGNRPPDVINVGGPALVAMVLASQLLTDKEYVVKFYGMAGYDENTDKILEILRQTPLDISNYKKSQVMETPSTDVFSDPEHDEGHGERTFVNSLGAALEYTIAHIHDSFFESDITCFGGTALVPHVHDHLTELLKKSRAHDCVTVVNTVFDFRNHKKNPDLPWPLVDREADYQLIDLLIMDRDEAIHISGKDSIEDAARFFYSTQVASFIITNGAANTLACSNGRLFEKMDLREFPVSAKIAGALQSQPKTGDTTGCGDNFAGAVVASMAQQLKQKGRGNLDLAEALAWGISAGGNCCFYVGGTYIEQAAGELRQKTIALKEDYQQQIAGS